MELCAPLLLELLKAIQGIEYQYAYQHAHEYRGDVQKSALSQGEKDGEDCPYQKEKQALLHSSFFFSHIDYYGGCSCQGE